jgi:hypothetical protein
VSADDREGICGDESPQNAEGMPRAICLLRFGHGSNWHEAAAGMRWKYHADDPESRGRAAGWREAIEALRNWDALGPFVAEYRAAERERRPLTGYDSSNIVLAAFLESLAPKETP